MESSLADGGGREASLLATEQGRRRLVKTALRITENTALAPGHYEQALLDRFVLGELTIDQVLAHLEAHQPS